MSDTQKRHIRYIKETPGGYSIETYYIKETDQGTVVSTILNVILCCKHSKFQKIRNVKSVACKVWVSQYLTTRMNRVKMTMTLLLSYFWCSAKEAEEEREEEREEKEEEQDC